VYVLCLLAGVYGTDVLCLLDLADHESLPQQDRLVLMRRLRAETTFEGRVLALAELCGLPLKEVARRVPCDASHLAEVVHGRKRPSSRLAAAWTTCSKQPGNWSRSPRRHRKTCPNRSRTLANRLATDWP